MGIDGGGTKGDRGGARMQIGATCPVPCLPAMAMKGVWKMHQGASLPASTILCSAVHTREGDGALKGQKADFVP